MKCRICGDYYDGIFFRGKRVWYKGEKIGVCPNCYDTHKNNKFNGDMV